MLSTLAVGEPSLGRVTGSGGFDLTPLVVAAATLLLLKVFLGTRIRWQVALVAVLAAPLLASAAERISYPMTAVLLLSLGWAISWPVRRTRSPRRPPPTTAG